MSTLWSPNLQVGELDMKCIDVSDVDEIMVEAEGYVYVEAMEGEVQEA